MSLLLAPYNNSMRLGQGFNSYTQSICVDSAVVVSPHREENFLNNLGQTMRTIALSNSYPSLWTKETEVLMDTDRLDEAKTAMDELTNDKFLTLSPERQEKIRAMRRRAPLEGKSSALVNNPAPAPPPYREHAGSSIIENSTRTWKNSNIGGPSQTVVYTSRFVNDLSSITKDMGISASLSIKAGTIAGSGRGSFIDSDKFLNSDLNYYISCKVTNQSINFKDPLEFVPLPDGVVDDEQFLQVYGDSYIQGFLEGGEFQALVSMKVLNKAKLTEIAAAAKVAFSSGALDIEASASFSLAKANINLNTETTITASWSGGGNIKHPNEPWTIESIIKVASRFPQNVARSPMRTYAVLQKYDQLRSYLALKPAKLGKMNYDNVALYTDELLDYFMVFKALYNNISGDIREIQQGTKRFRPNQQVEEGGYEASIDGLEEACRAIRPELSSIVERVEQITKRPDIVTDPQSKDYQEKFTSPVKFWEKLPIIESVRTGEASRPPLTGRRIGPEPEAKNGGGGQDAAREGFLASLCESEPSSLGLTVIEEAKFLKRLSDGKGNAAPGAKTQKSPAATMRLTRPVGSKEDGEPFFGFDFIKTYAGIANLSIGVAQGAIASISISYRNGLQWRRGWIDEEQEPFQLAKFAEDEMILSGSIEYGKPEDGKTKGTVTALKFFTNKGRTLHAAASKQLRYGFRCRYLDGRLFSNLEEFAFEAPLPKAVLTGFYGLSNEMGGTPGIHRLGFVWSTPKLSGTEVTRFATATGSLVGLLHAPLLVDKEFESDLLPDERAALLSPVAKLKNRGLRFGPCLGTSRPSAGTMFNDYELLTAIKQNKTDFPTRIAFVFSRSNDKAVLVSVRIWYGKVGLVHGADIDLESSNTHTCLDVKLGKDETIRSIQIPSNNDTPMPSGIAITTSKQRTLSLDAASGARSSSGLDGARVINGFQGMVGLKGFFGFETDTSLSRLLPIWA
ncbi:unnamed protein product [Tilletia controversa]|uniref:Jacalin-type lectin domain-containing protein n=3 Tax=Tilletia TaxID=13289 RepID=A0A8X7SXW6_9BASI|nr:hypothetical protein CF328_g2341 [Tilletia controversa]CAD6886564.1 unnamed protein product [Tilletia caries]CAD6940454.1 unnamed protein product [Tilletia laevis]KAE8249910.1 hypothetical protein A4X06_0g3014 [Tilletia controversa]CAD6910734.1 unnamed protein product [Tilletia caries]